MAKLTTRTAAIVGDIVDTVILWIDDAASGTSWKATWLTIRTKLEDYFVTKTVYDVSVKLNNFTATTDPGVGDDGVDGYAIGSRWINIAGQRIFECENSSTGAAVWLPVNADVFTVDVATVANQDYVLWYDAPFPGTIYLVRTESASGTCTVTVKINTGALGGTANSVSSTAQEQAHSSSNLFVKGDRLEFTVTSNSSCLTMSVAIYFVRTG